MTVSTTWITPFAAMMSSIITFESSLTYRLSSNTLRPARLMSDAGKTRSRCGGRKISGCRRERPVKAAWGYNREFPK